MKNTTKIATIGMALAIGVLGGIRSPLSASGEPTGECELNACSQDTGNCFVTTHSFDCDETYDEPGCKDVIC